MKRTARALPLLLAITALGVSASSAHAGDLGPQVPAFVTQSVIGSNALAGIRGRAAVNEAAGESNIQSNAAALAAGVGVNAARVGVTQSTYANQSGAPGTARAAISAGAFANASGLLSINQTSGLANAQSNTAALGLGAGVEVVADSTLATTISNAGPAVAGAGSKTRQQSVSISDTAFEGARGLVQVNQSAGSGNATANNFALSVQVGAKP
ncbi:MAG TPA: hypothetical protein VFW88_04695 [Burkholderiales bacterium]|nr:hypothetical protein [Burkholderiales bacterium]